MTPPKVIALEEHFTSPELRALRGENDTPVQRKLDDLGELRVREMDEAGIDLQIISENNPATRNLDAETAIKLARASNDLLFEAVPSTSGHFAGLLFKPGSKRRPTGWARCNKASGCPAIIRRPGHFMDDKQFQPIFSAPASCHFIFTDAAAAVQEAYSKHPRCQSPAQFIGDLDPHISDIVSGLFDEYPTLKIIVGHLGETAPFLLWRTDNILGERAPMPRAFADYYREHFWLTTSGAFSNSALTCSIAEMGVERILFAIDWPFMSNRAGRKWMDAAPVSDHDRTLILGANARKLLKVS